MKTTQDITTPQSQFIFHFLVFRWFITNSPSPRVILQEHLSLLIKSAINNFKFFIDHDFSQKYEMNWIFPSSTTCDRPKCRISISIEIESPNFSFKTHCMYNCSFCTLRKSKHKIHLNWFGIERYRYVLSIKFQSCIAISRRTQQRPSYSFEFEAIRYIFWTSGNTRTNSFWLF